MDRINQDFADFRYACERAPDRTFDFAKLVREMIGDTADTFLTSARALGLAVDNCDGIHDIEARLFDHLRTKNPASELDAAVGLGATLRSAPHDPLASHGSVQDILSRLVRERNFLDSLDSAREQGFMTTREAASLAETAGLKMSLPKEGPPAPGSYRADAALLEQGEGAMWSVRVTSSADDVDYVDFEVRAPTMEAAADKAEAHARKYADMYFENVTPTYHAERQNIYLMEDGA